MFNNNPPNPDSNNSTAIIKSGYDVNRGLQGFGTLRQEFADSLNVKPEEITTEAVLKNAKRAGQLQGAAALFKRVSRQKMAVARGTQQLAGAMLQHANQAAQLELGWQQQTARNVQQLSQTMLDMGVVQENHTGFSQYINVADSMINY